MLIQNISEIEGLLKENNRSLSAFAISILLKISKEDSVEQLLNQVEEVHLISSHKSNLISSSLENPPKNLRLTSCHL